MANTTQTPNMLLDLPIPSVQTGPQYATDLNQALTQVDSHNHSSGQGVQIPTAGISINADLSFNSFNATTLRSARMVNQGAPLGTATDINCLYASGGNLYFNSNAGQQVQITAGAALNAASIGGIGGDYVTSGASVFFTNATKTYFFYQTANTTGSMDCGQVTIHDNVASANGVTIKSPSSLAANYSLTFPAALPASLTSFLAYSTAGVGAFVAPDASTVEISSSTLRIKDLGVTTAKLADASVTQAKLAAVNIQTSSSCADFSTASATLVAVTNLSVTITTTGRPVQLFLNGDTSGVNEQSIGSTGGGAGGVMVMSFFRGASQLNKFHLDVETTNPMLIPPSAVSYVDTPAAGTYTYTFKVQIANNTARVRNSVLVAYEM